MPTTGSSRQILHQAQAASATSLAESWIVTRDSKKDRLPVLSLFRLRCRSRDTEQRSPQRVSGAYILILGDRLFFLADTTVNIEVGTIEEAERVFAALRAAHVSVVMISQGSSRSGTTPGR